MTVVAPQVCEGISSAPVVTLLRSFQPEDVNGAWLERTEVPPDRSWWGVPPELRALSEERQRAIIAEMASRTDLGPDSVARKIGAFFASLTDQSLVEVKAVILGKMRISEFNLRLQLKRPKTEAAKDTAKPAAKPAAAKG